MLFPAFFQQEVLYVNLTYQDGCQFDTPIKSKYTVGETNSKNGFNPSLFLYNVVAVHLHMSFPE